MQETIEVLANYLGITLYYDGKRVTGAKSVELPIFSFSVDVPMEVIGSKVVGYDYLMMLVKLGEELIFTILTTKEEYSITLFDMHSGILEAFKRAENFSDFVDSRAYRTKALYEAIVPAPTH